MAMKAYACPRCLTLSSTTEDGDGGFHTCSPSPFAAKLEARIAELEAALTVVIQKFDAEIASEYEGMKMLKERLKEIDPARKALNP